MIYADEFHDVTDSPNLYSPSICVLWPCAIRNVAPSSYGNKFRPKSFVEQEYDVIEMSGLSVIIPANGMCWNLGPICIPRYNSLNTQMDNVRSSIDALID